MTIANPGLIATIGAAQGIASAPVAITSTSAGTLTKPSGYSAGWAVVNNASPYLVTCSGAEGQNTIQPYQADRILPTAVGIAYAVTAPPGAVLLPPNPYIQVDWYVAGGGPPPGIFPYSLTSQAIAGLLATKATLLNGSAGVTTTPTVFNVNVPPCLGLLCELKLTAGTSDITLTAVDAAIGTLASFVVLAGTTAWPIRFEIDPNVGDSVQFTLTASAAGSTTCFLNVWAVQSTALDFLVPNISENSQSIAANATGTPFTFPTSAKVGSFTASAFTGLGVGTPAGAFLGVMQYYQGASNWLTLASIGGSATVAGIGAQILTPPGTCRFQPVNEAAAVQAVTSTFVQ